MNKVAFDFSVPKHLHRQRESGLKLFAVVHKMPLANYCTVDLPYLDEEQVKSVENWETAYDLIREEAKQMFNDGKGEASMWLTAPTIARYENASDTHARLMEEQSIRAHAEEHFQ